MRFKALYDKNNGTAPSLTNIRMAAVFCLTFLFCLFNVNIVSAGEPLWVAVGYGDTHSFASSNNGVDWTGRFGKDIDTGFQRVFIIYKHEVGLTAVKEARKNLFKSLADILKTGSKLFNTFRIGFIDKFLDVFHSAFAVHFLRL